MCGSSNGVTELLTSLDDRTFRAALRELPLVTLPSAVRPRALAVYRSWYGESTDPVERVRLLLLIKEMTGTSVIHDLKDELSKCPRGTLDHAGHYVIRPALDLIRKTEPEWVSHWVAERIADRSLYAPNWIALVTTVADDMKERLLQTIENEDLKDASYSGQIPILAAIGDARMADRAVDRICEVRPVIASAPNERHDLEWALERQLNDLFCSFPVDVEVIGLGKRLASDIEPVELTVITQLFSRVGRSDSDLRKRLREDLRQTLRNYLIKGVPIVLREDDFTGEQKAHLASSLAQIGEPEDVTLLRELIHADIARRKRGMEARMRGDRGKLGNGAVMTYASWHVRAVLQLPSGSAEELLLETLKEPEYESASAWGLVQLASASRLEFGLGFGLGYIKHTDYEKIWDARQGRWPLTFNEERRKRYATAIRERIESLLEESRSSGQVRAYDFRLKELTKILAVIDSEGSSDLILELLTSQDTLNNWPIVQALDTLVFNEIVLPTDKTLRIFDTSLRHVRSHLWDDQRVQLLMRALCLLPFIENAAAGIATIREVVAELNSDLMQ